MRSSRRTIQSSVVLLTALLALVSLAGFLPAPALAQGPPLYPPVELERLVSRIALYPDPLLAQILAAATYPGDIPEAARWADQHHYLTGDALARNIEDDRLPWDPSVQALLPFPSVLGMMASDMRWTEDLGNAFLGQPGEVMDAVQRMRQRARDYGYLRSNGQIIVSGGPYIEILPARADYIVVPYYDPGVIFVGPRRGYGGGVISFGFGVTLGAAYRPWGWGYNRMGWNQHTVIINNAPWGRTWVNRNGYAHPYTVQRYVAPRPVERHELRERSERERQEERSGRRYKEEHRGNGRGDDRRRR